MGLRNTKAIRQMQNPHIPNPSTSFILTPQESTSAREIYVAVPPDSCADNVRSFPTFTEDLHALRDWLKQCGVTAVAMESTGVYWIPLFPDPRRLRHRSLSGQCAPLQEPARSQD